MHLNAQREDMQKQTSNIHKCVYNVHHWQQRLSVHKYATCMSVKFQTKCIIFAYIAPYLICSYLDMQNYAENMHQHRLYTDCTHK